MSTPLRLLRARLSVALFYIVCFFALSACSKISSNEVDASSIYGEIQLERNESSSNVQVDASFYVGGGTGTVVELDSPAGVKINGSNANEINEPITNMTYYRANPGLGAGSAAVVYTDKESKTYTNTVGFPGIFYESVPGAVSRSGGFTVSYSSDVAFAGGEQLEVTLSSGNASSWQGFSLVTGQASGSQVISPSALSGFSTGSLTVKLCRKRGVSAQQPYPKGLIISVRSCANPVTTVLGN